MYDLIKAQLATAVPFVAFLGIDILQISPDGAHAALEQRTETSNHLATMHAGALFALGESASGAAMSGIFASMLMNIRPVAAAAEIRFVKAGKGRVEARARAAEPAMSILERFEADGRAKFAVDVEMVDAQATIVAAMTVDWVVARRAS